MPDSCTTLATTLRLPDATRRAVHNRQPWLVARPLLLRPRPSLRITGSTQVPHSTGPVPELKLAVLVAGLCL